jgi:hypothetical protein
MQAVLNTLIVNDDFILWVTLAILLGLVVLIGQKAGASSVELKVDAGYKRPMIALEMNGGAASRMFKSWDETTRESLRKAVLWDYLFIFIYPAAIATACFIAARFLDRSGIISLKYGLIIMCLQLVAAAFDAIENYALLKVLDGATSNPWPQMARWCALTKFSFILVGGFYVLIVGGEGG